MGSACDRPVPDAIVERGQLVGADLVAIDAVVVVWPARSQRIPVRRRASAAGSAGEKIAPRQVRH